MLDKQKEKRKIERKKCGVVKKEKKEKKQWQTMKRNAIEHITKVTK